MVVAVINARIPSWTLFKVGMYEVQMIDEVLDQVSLTVGGAHCPSTYYVILRKGRYFAPGRTITRFWTYGFRAIMAVKSKWKPQEGMIQKQYQIPVQFPKLKCDSEAINLSSISKT